MDNPTPLPKEDRNTEPKEKNHPGWFHLGLFVVTFICTTFAGSQWYIGKPFWLLSWDEFQKGLIYSTAFLGILTVHEFGHYFTAKHHRLKVTLPYYIPLWLFGLLPMIGTMGAVIKIKSYLKSKKQVFDVGVSGPLAGFVIIVPLLWFGMINLPDLEYLYNIHPDYEEYGTDYPEYAYENLADSFIVFNVGTNLLVELGKEYLVEDTNLFPVPQEMTHYPLLFACILACFFTALNLIPIGQLDGGHILYGIVGPKWHGYLSMAFFSCMIFYGGLGMFSGHDPFSDLLTYGLLYVGFLYVLFERNLKSKQTAILVAVSIFTVQFLLKTYFPNMEGQRLWLGFGFVVGRFLGIYHPPTPINEPLGWKRITLAVAALIVFVLCFTPAPLSVS